VSDKFIDLVLDERTLYDIEKTPKGKGVVITYHNGKEQYDVIVTNTAFSQLLRLIGYEKVSDIKKMLRDTPRRIFPTITDRIYKRLEEGKPIILSCVKVDEGILKAFRVTSEEYTPIPHRELFNAVQEALEVEGIKIIRTEYCEWIKRVGMTYYLKEVELKFVKVRDVLASGLLVTNANTAHDSIRLFAFNIILSCRNGLTTRELAGRIYLRHVGIKQEILKRVKVYAVELARKIIDASETIADNIVELEQIEVERRELNGFIIALKNKMPRKWHRLTDSLYRSFLKKHGYTLLTGFQVTSGLTTRVTNATLQQKLQKLSEEILTTRTLPRV